jgi:hypothetical protein
MTIDTACSSSLAAVHLAVQQLRSGQSNMAVAAGANLILGPMTFVLESKLNMLSPMGRSRMWDADADGYARGVCYHLSIDSWPRGVDNANRVALLGGSVFCSPQNFEPSFERRR